MKLTRLACSATSVTSLLPLEGMALTDMDCAVTQVSDLSPLKGMPLTYLACGWTQVSSLSPLNGMPLRILYCWKTQVSDLSPLQGTPLTSLDFNGAPVSDLSPLEGMNLTDVCFTPKNITKGMNIIRQMKSLSKIGINWDNRLSPAEFWKKCDAGEFGKPDSTAATPDRKPITNINDPAFQQWMKTVAVLPAGQQVEAVAKKLQALNPGFDGKVESKLDGGAVLQLGFNVDHVTDISPVRALLGLKGLGCYSSDWGRAGKLSDLSPLRGMQLAALECPSGAITDLSQLAGMPLAHLVCYGTQISDLSPLKGMPLTYLEFGDTKVTDLSPLGGMQLKRIYFHNTPVSDLSPLKGMPLTAVACDGTLVSDLSPLAGADLHGLNMTAKNIVKGMDIIRRMKGLKLISGLSDHENFPPDVFWKKYDAGEFGR
jgi:Leucine-rich repeat (LRR) protein